MTKNNEFKYAVENIERFLAWALGEPHSSVDGWNRYKWRKGRRIAANETPGIAVKVSDPKLEWADWSAQTEGRPYKDHIGRRSGLISFIVYTCGCDRKRAINAVKVFFKKSNPHAD